MNLARLITKVCKHLKKKFLELPVNSYFICFLKANYISKWKAWVWVYHWDLPFSNIFMCSSGIWRFPDCAASFKTPLYNRCVNNLFLLCRCHSESSFFSIYIEDTLKMCLYRSRIVQNLNKNIHISSKHPNIKITIEHEADS